MIARYTHPEMGRIWSDQRRYETWLLVETAAAEAMAAALPCVSTRIAGVPEMVIDGATGLLCEERHPEQLAGLIGALLQDPARCEAMGAAGLEHAKRRFAKEVTSRDLLRAFAAQTACTKRCSTL